MIIAIILCFAFGAALVGAAYGWSAGYQSAIADVRRAKLGPLVLRTEIPADYAVRSVRIGAYQMLTGPMPLLAFNGSPVQGQWVVRQHAKMAVQVQCLRTGVLRVCSSERWEDV